VKRPKTAILEEFGSPNHPTDKKTKKYPAESGQKKQKKAGKKRYPLKADFVLL